VKKILVAFALTLPLVAQTPDGLPVVRHVILAPGSGIDLDSGVVLPGGDHGPLRADVTFGRDGLGFFVQPRREGMPARPADWFPEGEWSQQRLRIPRRSDGQVWTFLRTDHGVARLSIAIVDPYSTASAAVSWTVVPPKDPVFLAAPTDLRLRWHEGKLLVGWDGTTPQFLVEVVSGEQRSKQVCTVNGCEFDGLDEDAVHLVRVRGMDGGAISVPAEAVQHGRSRPPVYEVTQYPDRWYDQEGGLGLSVGADNAEKAEVVFYLYGVFVPGGGVQKLGSGRETFVSTKDLPTSGYLPSYGRLDDHDVHAVRLPDGRRALLWLEPADGDDVRDGMNVHSVFLPDGRGHLLVPPHPTVASDQRVVTLTWPRVEGAKGYEVRVGGDKPILTDQLTATFDALPKDRMHAFTVRSLGEDGGWSLERKVFGHTFGTAAVFRRVTVRAQTNSVDLKTGKTGKQGDLSLVGGAGGASYLRFGTPYGSCANGGRAFGDFDGLQRGKADHFGSDDREDDVEQFFVWTKDGGCACVRIVVRDWPDTVVEYVWLPPEDGGR
jgi:hypothetical protein